MSQTQSFPQLVEATCVKVEGCRLERFSWEESDWWLIRQADDNQIKWNNSKRCTIRVGSIGCSGFVNLNLSKSSFPSFFPAALVITVSKTVETKGLLVLPGLLSWNESPCFLILNNLQATWIKYIKVHTATRWTIRHSLMLLWLLLLLIGFAQMKCFEFHWKNYTRDKANQRRI